MVYTNLFVKKQFKIPTLLSIPIVLLLSFFLGRLVLTPSKTAQAEKKNVRNVKVSNIFSNQATVYWQTDKKEQGWIIYGNSSSGLNGIALDERDSATEKKEYVNHYVILKNLNENAPYYFKVASKDGLASRSNGQPFNFQTLAKSSGVSNLRPAYGKVADKNGSPLENAVVFLNISGSMTLSTITKSSGEWLIPLNFVTDSQTKALKTLSGVESTMIEVVSESNDVSKINTIVSNLNPFPETITIGKDYELIEKQEVLSARTGGQSTKAIPLDILFPRANAVIPDDKPLIKGTATPGSSLQISVTDGKNKTTKRVTADKVGQWKMDVVSPLAAGKHTLEVKTSVGGKESLLKREFTVAKSGEKVLGEATGGAVLTTTPTATPSPTEVSTTSATITATPTPPVSGSGLFYITLSSLTFIVIGLGLFFYGLL